MITVIELTDTEIRQVAITAADRMIDSIRKGLRHSHGYDGNDEWGVHFGGAAAEKAFCKFVDGYDASTVSNFNCNGGADYRDNVQIRWTKNDSGRLIVRPSDDSDHFYYLVVGPVERMRVVGGIKGANAKQDQFKTNFGNPQRPEVYAVPQNHLRLRNV